MALATMQQLRSFTRDEHPLNLEPGQIAFNMSPGNYTPENEDFNAYLYVGNSSNKRLDEDGTVLIPDGSGELNKGWVRYRLRNLSPEGGTIRGDFTVAGGKLTVTANGSVGGELVLPTQAETPTSGSSAGSVRWNTVVNKVEAWTGGTWTTTTSVTVQDTAPTIPLNGDLWMDTSGPYPTLMVYVVPASGPAEWKTAVAGEFWTALQPGNGVSSNAQNQIEIINTGSY